ncbi:hypothetical protein ABTZ99_11830 [Actinosynnema sp. NPDC002837]
MKTILFVHGTGVRDNAYWNTFRHVCAGVASIRPGWRVEHCYWGDRHGARLNANGVTIPGTSDRGFGVPEDDPDTALWWMLDHDPLVELRALAVRPAEAVDLPPTADAPGEWLVEAARDLPDERLAALLDDAGLADVFGDAVDEVLADDGCRRALDREHELGGVLTTALARAIVARCLHLADERQGPDFPLDGDTRDDVVDAIVSELGGSDRGIGAVAVELVMRAGVGRAIDRRRAVLSQAAAPVAGDVLLYLTRGAGLRGFIADRIAGIDTPVVVLAHSLGGIAALELMIERELPNVAQLITVGSQAPLLYELNALPALAHGALLPDSVPADWVNIYDRRDLLAYVGSGVFPDRVRDFAVDNRAPFPRSHSAYFAKRNKRFYGLLDRELA